MLPLNENVSSLCELLADAHSCYSKQTDRPLCVLMVVQHANFNIADERPIEYGLWDRHIRCYRCEWSAVLGQTQLLPDRTLVFQPSLASGECEVAVVYYRAGYDAAEYGESGQQTRFRLELARSIKCPDVLTHLTTLKVVQRALAEAVPKGDSSAIDVPMEVSRTFMQMHSLAAPDMARLAIQAEFAKDFVLKPNLEGGGHNIYREAIVSFVRELPQAEWSKYTLMRLIEPPKQEGILMTPDDLYRGRVVSELGVLGTCLWQRTPSGAKIHSNKTAGWTFKTKPEEVDEMSVVKGYGCFDCPLLHA